MPELLYIYIYLYLRQGFDWTADEIYQNLGTDLGFLKGIGLLLRLAQNGLFFGGVPCDSFGFMSSPTHGRSSLCPFGNHFPFVHLGNLLTTRYGMLALVCIIRGCVWAIEQPERSAIAYLPAIQLLLREYLQPRMVKWFLCGNMCFVLPDDHPCISIG